MKPIAHIYTNISGKFGVPRQSGVIESLSGKIVFEPEYRVQEAFRGLSDFSHIWLIWDFSESHIDAEQAEDKVNWSPTVRPPRLGGNKRMGVFATRSPFRPNGIGLSAVKLEKIEFTDDLGPILFVSGVDLMNGTPIYDVKPYIPYADSIPNAAGGFTNNLSDLRLNIDIDETAKKQLEKIPDAHRAELLEILSHDPRPQYIDDPERIYGINYLDFDVRFKIRENTLNIVEIKNQSTEN